MVLNRWKFLSVGNANERNGVQSSPDLWGKSGRSCLLFIESGSESARAIDRLLRRCATVTFVIELLEVRFEDQAGHEAERMNGRAVLMGTERSGRPWYTIVLRGFP